MNALREPVAPIVLGHNGFFGVDHLSKRRGAEREAQFEQTQAILDFIGVARGHGVESLMVSTHERATPLARAIRADAQLKDRIGWYLLLPYINKYVRAANEKGLVNVVLDQIKGVGIGQKLMLFGRGGMGLVRQDFNQMIRALVQIEMSPFRDLRIEAVFLHDVLTDLMLAYNAKPVAELYLELIATQYKAKPAFATKNLPLLLERFASWNLDPHLILTHVNQIGFNMNPSREQCEQTLRHNATPIMAMGSLASGYLKPADAYRYIGSLRRHSGGPAVDSIVVGVSRPQHAAETFAAIREHVFADAAGVTGG